MTKSYKKPEQCVKEGLGTEVRRSNNIKIIKERKQSRGTEICPRIRSAFVKFNKGLINCMSLL